jgi:hypothetical protein
MRLQLVQWTFQTQRLLIFYQTYLLHIFCISHLLDNILISPAGKVSLLLT